MKRDTRRASAKTRSSVDHVKLGCSFFEKWVVRLKFGASREKAPLSWGELEATSTPASCSRRSTTVRVEGKGAARRGPSCSHGPNLDAGGGSNRRFERPGRGASSALLRIAKPDAAGGCSGQSGSSVPSGARSEPPSSGETTGGARLADMKRQRSETPVGLSQPTAQMVLTRVVLAATSEPLGARP